MKAKMGYGDVNRLDSAHQTSKDANKTTSTTPTIWISISLSLENILFAAFNFQFFINIP